MTRDRFEDEEVTFDQMAERLTRYDGIRLGPAPWLTDILDGIGEIYDEEIERYRSLLDREVTHLRRLVDENGVDLYNPATARGLLLGLLFSTNFLVNVTPSRGPHQPAEQMRLLCHELRDYAQA